MLMIFDPAPLPDFTNLPYGFIRSSKARNNEFVRIVRYNKSKIFLRSEPIFYSHSINDVFVYSNQ